MERSEPTLVPEWLKSGSVTGGGGGTHHFSSSSLHSDRTSSSYFRRISSNNGIIHDKELSAYSRSYSSCTRNHRDKDWEKDALGYHEKEKSVLGDFRDRDFSDPLASILPNRIEKNMLRRSQSMLSAKRGELRPKRVIADSNSDDNSSQNNGNVLLVGDDIISRIRKSAFEKDFPSLGAEESQGVPDIGRVSSPGLSTTVQSLPIGTSSIIGGNGWTSALAEVPMIIRSNSMGPSSTQETATVSSVPAAPSTVTGLNMAETITQVPSRARITPLLSVESQRFEELAIKQSRQLIPMTPSMPKALVSNYSEKSKPKTVARTGDMTIASKVGPLSSSCLPSHSFRSGPVRLEDTKTFGKFLPLKQPWEKVGVSVASKDCSSPINASTVSTPLAVAPLAASSLLRSPINPKVPTAERKTGPLAAAATHGFSVEKKPTTTQAQSRNDFFNLMRNKTCKNHSPNISVVTSPSMVKCDDSLTEVTSTASINTQGSNAPSSVPCGVQGVTDNGGGDITSNGDACEEESMMIFSNNLENHSAPNAIVYPDEEEAAFLRSLGWEENAIEEEGLTEEEINAFYKEYIKLKPSSKLCNGTQPKLSMPLKSSHGVSSGLCSPDSETKA